ncbi:glycosyl transferase family 1 [Leptolinea sp. HRD-7]|nr:glycosyl transferase family 1 [Leptolinea sp. HRD-7]
MKTLLFANTAWYLYNFRLPLAEALRARGFDVVLVSPSDENADKLIQAGFRWVEFPFSRKGQNPLQEIGTISRLVRLYRDEKPDFVHHFTIKCVLYGSLAARWTGIHRVINSITGLGYVFLANNLKARLIRPIILFLYRFALRSTQVIFQNGDDLRQFETLHLISPGQTRIVRGSGVDITRFVPSPEPAGPAVVVLPARLLWDKGVGEFVQAARVLKAEGSDGRFVLVGDIYADNPASVPESAVRDWEKEGVIEWWGWRGDMPEVFSKSSIVCLPSYREGLPKTLIEAAGCARPLVAFDAPGCREVVIPGETGLLAKFKDVDDLAACLRNLLRNPEERRRMGANARHLAETEFSTGRIVNETLEVYSKLQGDTQR